METLWCNHGFQHFETLKQMKASSADSCVSTLSKYVSFLTCRVVRHVVKWAWGGHNDLAVLTSQMNQVPNSEVRGELGNLQKEKVKGNDKG